VTKDPERAKRRAETAAKLGISAEELRQQRVDEDARHLERKAEEAGLPVDRYLAQRRKDRNKTNKAKQAAKREAK
jgi:hypothetical protein